MGTSKAPSAWFYAIGPAVIGITSVVAIVLFVVGILGMAPDARVVVPGSHEVQFDKTGEYIVYYEYESTVDGVAYSTDEHLHGMVATLRSQDGSRIVPLTDAAVNSEYSIGSRSGVSIFEFDIDEPGTYILTAEYQNGRVAPEVVLAVGQFNIVEVLLRSIPLGLVGFVLGVILIVLVLVKRRKAGKTI